MKATQQAVANSLALQSITSPTAAAAAGNTANTTTIGGSGTPSAPAASSGSNAASAQLTIGHYIFGRHHIIMISYLLHAGKSLGKGTFGKVKLATHTLTGEKVMEDSAVYIKCVTGCGEDT
jgi:hypothetical protein